MNRRRNRTVKLRKKNRRRRIGMLVYRLLCIAAILGVALLALTVFFKIQVIEIKGTERYTPEQVREVLDTQTGDNLFFWGKRAGIQRLTREFPYISEAKVRRKLPDTLVIEVVECEAVAAIDDGSGGCYLISAGRKLLEQIENASNIELPFVAGVSVGAHKIGEILRSEDAEELDSISVLAALLPAMQAEGQLKNVDFINITDPFSIHVGYLERFDVHLGTVQDLERKVKFLTKIVNEKLSPSDIGTIELSNVSKMYFWPDKLENIQSASGREQAVDPALLPEDQDSEENNLDDALDLERPEE